MITRISIIFFTKMFLVKSDHLEIIKLTGQGSPIMNCNVYGNSNDPYPNHSPYIVNMQYTLTHLQFTVCGRILMDFALKVFFS